jgi:hypothetical protein
MPQQTITDEACTAEIEKKKGGRKMTQYRQGDVFIESATGIPKGARPVARVQGRIILAEGEVTGHAHAVLDLGAVRLLAALQKSSLAL